MIIAVSGGFDPIHIGHIRYINEAKKLGGKLVVILNNDNWLVNKKGKAFMPELERKEILESLIAVDEVIITKHKLGCKDMSVCDELRKLKPNVFAKGGDSIMENTPEVELCKEMGTIIAFNVGSGKIQSSSWLIRKWEERSV